jgi:hypothetical protein
MNSSVLPNFAWGQLARIENDKANIGIPRNVGAKGKLRLGDHDNQKEKESNNPRRYKRYLMRYLVCAQVCEI